MREIPSTVRSALLMTVFLLGVPTLYVIASSLTLRGEEPPYGINIWRETQGLPQSRIRAITQTRDGYL